MPTTKSNPVFFCTGLSVWGRRGLGLCQPHHAKSKPLMFSKLKTLLMVSYSALPPSSRDQEGLVALYYATASSRDLEGPVPLICYFSFLNKGTCCAFSKFVLAYPLGAYRLVGSNPPSSTDTHISNSSSAVHVPNHDQTGSL